jgi:Uma2 family endonuclease
MNATVRTMTAEELFMMPEDGFLYELVKGELRKMSLPGSEHGMRWFIRNVIAWRFIVQGSKR